MPSIPPVRPEVAAPSDVRAAIRQASERTGVPFRYLVAQAEQESGLRPDARAASGSAAGLYQFIESTWLRMVRDHGAKYGIGPLAREISTGGDGTPRVADPETRARILALRDDPKLAAMMAAEYARSNHAALSQAVRREIGATDLYFGHFLGPAGAARFLTALRDEPGWPAADLLPEAAAANRGVFFDGEGRARSVRDIYSRFAAKFESGPIAAASAGAAPPDMPASPALEAVLRRTALAALSGHVLSPAVIAALAALDAPPPARNGQTPPDPAQRNL